MVGALCSKRLGSTRYMIIAYPCIALKYEYYTKYDATLRM